MSDVIYLDHFRNRQQGQAPRIDDSSDAPIVSFGRSRRDEARAARDARAARHGRPLAVTTADRDLRYKQWNLVMVELAYWAALRRMAEVQLVAESVGALRVGEAPHLIGTDLVAQHNEIIKAHREAQAKLLLTPAPFAACVLKKETIQRSSEFQFLPVTSDQVEAQLVADEAFLKACPRRPKGSVVRE